MIEFEEAEQAFSFICQVVQWRPVSVLLAACVAPDGEAIPQRKMTVYGPRHNFKPEFRHPEGVFFS